MQFCGDSTNSTKLILLQTGKARVKDILNKGLCFLSTSGLIRRGRSMKMA